MCGIFGFVIPRNSQLTAKSTTGLLTDLFLLSETRGKESAGLHLHLPSKNKNFTLKGALRASELVGSAAYANLCKEALAESFPAAAETSAEPLIAIAHSRLVTNGAAEKDENNQPVRRSGATVVHNGIVVNVDDLWSLNPDLTRTAEVDTEIISATLGQWVGNGTSAVAATRRLFRTLKGTASIAWVHERGQWLLLSTNTGDLYTFKDPTNRFIVFASELYILKEILLRLGSPIDWSQHIQWLAPGNGVQIDAAGTLSPFGLAVSEKESASVVLPLSDRAPVHKDISASTPGIIKTQPDEKLLRYNEKRIALLRRCSKCVLPETFPFINFNENGECNYCRSYQSRYRGRKTPADKQSFIESLSRYRRSDGKSDCIVAFSGGRDSSYGLHLIKKEFNLNPITFTYDWGMVTDLARRNIARICGELGVQNILVSADIKKKRDNIRKNVSAWLRNPDLGIVPLFMAGDKHFFRIVNQLKRQTGINLDLWCANPLENTDFKTGFCGVSPDFEKDRVDFMSVGRKVRMAAYYGSRFLENPAYINSSIVDTLGAFSSYYFEPRRDFFFIFDHFLWDEDEVNTALISNYDWELAPDTASTWRIGDGTAPFYNYIYMSARGFSEFDTFRSNQIREGMMTREAALSSILIENRPRAPSIRWYLDAIDLDFNSVIRTINSLDVIGLHAD